MTVLGKGHKPIVGGWTPPITPAPKATAGKPIGPKGAGRSMGAKFRRAEEKKKPAVVSKVEIKSIEVKPISETVIEETVVIGSVPVEKKAKPIKEKGAHRTFIKSGGGHYLYDDLVPSNDDKLLPALKLYIKRKGFPVSVEMGRDLAGVQLFLSSDANSMQKNFIAQFIVGYLTGTGYYID